jgi:glycosyltransferase involved in cell wall biosynthesis
MASAPPRSGRVAALQASLEEAGAEATFVVYRSEALGPVSRGHEVRALLASAERHGPAFRRQLRGLNPVERFWHYISQDEWVAAQIALAPVVIGLDRPARIAAERLAAQYGGVRVATSREQVLQLLREPVGNRVRQLLTRIRAPSGKRRITPYEAAWREALAYLDAGDLDAAERAVDQAQPGMTSAREVADLRGDLANAALAGGLTPRSLVSTVAAELAVADDHCASGCFSEAGLAVAEAMRVAFHRTAHLDGLSSPLAQDPRGFAEPLLDSQAMQRLCAPRGRRRSDTGSAGKPGERPRRVLVATWGNSNFLGEIREELSARADVEARFLDAKGFPELRPWVRDVAAIAEQILGDEQELVDLVDRQLGPHLNWADVVFVDWCTMLPALLTLLDPGDTRVIVRLHSVEAFTFWPQLVDFSRVDDMVFVSAHLRDLVVSSVPALSGPRAPRLHVLPLALQLERFSLPKTPATPPGRGAQMDPRFTLGLIGWSAVAKDPLWALGVIRRLREHDDRYRLLLIGNPFHDQASEAARRYGVDLRRELADLEGQGAVARRDHTDDVPRALREIGVILSSSVREGCHTAVMEGAASGAVPVVRDWPFFAGGPNGASTLFPPEWVVSSPEEAAARILKTTETHETWATAGAEASSQAFSRWAWDNVRPRYEQILLR